MTTSPAWCRSQVCLVGKNVIITGGNAGIGYETALDLAKRGARVIIACRDHVRGKEAAAKIKEETDNPNVLYKRLDLASLQSVRDFCNKTETKLDILINNAGAVGLKGTTKDGLHTLLQVNHLGHFLLTDLLLGLLKKSAPSRIINVSSGAAQHAPTDWVFDVHNKISNPSMKEMEQYQLTKLCNILYTIELNKRIQGTGVTVYSLHPGIVSTDFSKGLSEKPPPPQPDKEGQPKRVRKNPIEGAQTTIYCAVEKGIENLSGEHFDDCRVIKRYASATNPEAPKALWVESAKLVGLAK